MYSKKQVIQRIESLRKEHGLTQSELAEQAGTTRPYFSKIKRSGHVGPAMINRLLKPFGLRLKYVFEELPNKEVENG
ncbi:MAG: helix-turn-helix transcriptional regulator [Bacteroidota bacterium]